MFYPLQQDTLNNTFQSFWQQAEWLKCDSIVKNANGEVLSTVNKSASIEDVITADNNAVCLRIPVYFSEYQPYQFKIRIKMVEQPF